MLLFPSAQADELPGDCALRRFHRAIVLCLFSPIVGLALLALAILMVKSGLFPPALSSLIFEVGTLAIFVGLIWFALMAVFLRVESRYMPRSKPVSMVDRIAIGLGMLITFLPAAGVLYVSIRALITDSVRYHFPSEMIKHAADPYAYWQGIGFWTMGAMSLAYLAGVYWRSRWKKLNPDVPEVVQQK